MADRRLIGLQKAATADAASNTVDACWADETFGRCIAMTDNQWLYLDVELDREATAISISIDQVPQQVLLDLLPAGFARQEAEWVRFAAGPLVGRENPVPTLRDAAAAVIGIADTAVAATPKRARRR